MCMYSSTDKTKKAGKPIKCWKVLEAVKAPDGTVVYITPYYFQVIGPEQLSGAEPVRPDRDSGYSIQQTCFGNAYRVDGGFIHTFGELNADAMCELMADLSCYIGDSDYWLTESRDNLLRVFPQWKDEWDDEDSVVSHFSLFECEIPAGSEYIAGDYEDRGLKCYASDAVVYRKEIARIAVQLNNATDDGEKWYAEKRYVDPKLRELLERLKEFEAAETEKEDQPCA